MAWGPLVGTQDLLLETELVIEPSEEIGSGESSLAVLDLDNDGIEDLVGRTKEAPFPAPPDYTDYDRLELRTGSTLGLTGSSFLQGVGWCNADLCVPGLAGHSLSVAGEGLIIGAPRAHQNQWGNSDIGLAYWFRLR